MQIIDGHRKTGGEKLEIYQLKPPFSFFDFIEKNFGHCDSIRRIFSLARSFQANTLIFEYILPVGIIEEENNEILKFFPDYTNDGLFKLSFWKKEITEDNIDKICSDDLIGYSIIKRDVVPSIGRDRWHIFEAVFLKYPHKHNYIPYPHTYRLKVANTLLEINGLLYCQQNQLNKSCAQVALRSILSRILPEGDISYNRINEIADTLNPGFIPHNGLSVPQLRGVLTELGIKFNDIDYTFFDEEMLKELPYQKYAYAGLESGCGALLGFRLAGRGLQEEAKHIIPIYGHTFNKDTWVPNAEIAYFRIGEGVGYIPSESWTSSFLGHDDNFGPNYCIPRLYIENDKVDYVVEIFKPGISYSGVQAEAIALNILYSILPEIPGSDNKWLLRLIAWTEMQKIVFRAVAISTDEYISHLSTITDWDNNNESPELCEFLAKEMPSHLWIIEISTPQLFPANERKVGEIVLDATQPLNVDEGSMVYNVFIFARLPGIYMFGGDISNGNPQFTPILSKIISHTDLIKF